MTLEELTGVSIREPYVGDPPRRVTLAHPLAKHVQVRHLPSRIVLDDVVEADEEAGYVVRIRQDLPHVNGQILYETVHCQIRIEWQGT